MVYYSALLIHSKHRAKYLQFLRKWNKLHSHAQIGDINNYLRFRKVTFGASIFVYMLMLNLMFYRAIWVIWANLAVVFFNYFNKFNLKLFIFLPLFHGIWQERFYFWKAKLRVVMIMMMMNCYCGMVDWRKAFSLISSRDHCQRCSLSRIFNTLRAGIEPTQSLSSGIVEWGCAVVITSTQE